MHANFNTLLLYFILYLLLLCIHGNRDAISVMPTVQLHKGGGVGGLVCCVLNSFALQSGCKPVMFHLGTAEFPQRGETSLEFTIRTFYPAVSISLCQYLPVKYNSATETKWLEIERSSVKNASMRGR